MPHVCVCVCVCPSPPRQAVFFHQEDERALRKLLSKVKHQAKASASSAEIADQHALEVKQVKVSESG